MKDFDSLHQKIQEHIDCCATTDPLKEMSGITPAYDTEDAAVKWLALAILHGINNQAEKIEFYRDNTGEVHVSAVYRKTDLPSPGKEIGESIFKTARQVIHADGDKAKSILSVGIRQDSLDLKIKVKSDGGKAKLSLKFPEA